MIVQLAVKNRCNRKLTAPLTVLSIAHGVVLLLGVERIRNEACASLLAVGAPSAHEFGLIMLVVVAGVQVGLVPVYRIYGFSVADGMSIRI